MIKCLKCDKQLSAWQPTTTTQPGHKKSPSTSWEMWVGNAGKSQEIGEPPKSPDSLEGSDRVTVSYGLDILWHAFHLSVDFANCAPPCLGFPGFCPLFRCKGHSQHLSRWLYNLAQSGRQKYAAKSQKIHKANEGLGRKQSQLNKIQIERRGKLKKECRQNSVENNFSARSLSLVGKVLKYLDFCFPWWLFFCQTKFWACCTLRYGFNILQN